MSRMALYSGGYEVIYPFNGCGGHGRLKKSDHKIVNLQIQIQNAANQNQKQVLADWDADSQVNDF